VRTVVCLKLVADPDIVEFDIASGKLRNSYPVLDPIGSYVLEEGLALRERLGGEVIAVTVAPEAGDVILKNALLGGADKAVRLWRDDLRDADTWLVARAIGGYLLQAGCDLVLCGARSRDTATGLMSPALGYYLNAAAAVGIIALEAGGDGRVLAHKKLPGGRRETYTMKLPAVIGLEEGVNEPGYVAPFSRTYRAGMNKTVELGEPAFPPGTAPLVRTLRLIQARPRVKTGLNLAALSPQDRLKMMRGELGRKKEIFTGPPEEAARRIFDRLKEALK
jgi:electron transfer flavoprotein alpha/beta subunit